LGSHPAAAAAKATDKSLFGLGAGMIPFRN